MKRFRWILGIGLLLFSGGPSFVVSSDVCLPCAKNLEILGDGLIKHSPSAQVVVKERLPSLGAMVTKIWEATGVLAFVTESMDNWSVGVGKLVMILLGLLLIYLAIIICRPLLLIPIAFSCILSNIPLAGISEEGGILHYVAKLGITSGVFPLIIFMGLGAITDFGPMIARPITMLLGGATQLTIFLTLIGTLALSSLMTGINFNLQDAASIAMIGSGNGPAAIFLAEKLSPRLIGAIGVAVYAYMALLPIMGPHIMGLLATTTEREIGMEQLRPIGKREKIIFPLLILGISILLLPSAAPLIGMLMLGNLLKECGMGTPLTKSTQNALLYVTTIFFGLGVGSKLTADSFLHLETLGIIILGVIAFFISTISGILIAKLLNLFLKDKINPWIGVVGIWALPLAFREKIGANVTGVIGPAVAVGVLLTVFG